ncbi:MAG TPA: Ig-like domain-containing protein, partial [Steroidobacteraceae bacterium]|nr:Ig-like domain-containing protein [Steroidobacteraceae bacterium]
MVAVLCSGTATAAPPIAVDDFYQTISAIDSGNTSCYGVTQNDSDPDGDSFFPVAVTPGSGGTPLLQEGSVCFAQSLFFRGTATFGYTIEDTNGEQASATVTLEILNREPTPGSCQTQAESGVPLQFGPLACAGVQPDPEFDSVELIAITQPANGSAFLLGDGGIEYRSNPGFTGNDTFSYTIQDSFGATGTASISIDVTPFVNDPPVANDDAAQTRSGPTGGFPVSIDVLANDSDPDGDPLQYVNLIYSEPANGTITRQGLLIYTPNAGFVGQDSFSYEIDDGDGATDSAFVTIDVTASQAPVANADSYDLEAYPAETEIDFLANDSDPDGDPLLYNNVTITTPPAHGSVNINCVGSCATPTYQPQIGYAGPDSFTYTIDDGLGAQSTATVTLNVLPSASGPTATDDSASTV